jgi:hypothetical protein
MKKLNKEQWLTEMPKLIYKLKFNYNFYFNGCYSIIKKDILEIVKNPKNKHKISVYNKDNRFFLVVYRKGSPDIYVCTEYKNDTSSNRIKYFMKKFIKSYKKAEEAYEEQIYTNNVVNTRRIQ